MSPTDRELRALQEAARLMTISRRGDQPEHDQLLDYAKQTTEAEPIELAVAALHLAALATVGLANAKSVEFEVALQHVLDAASAD